MPSKSPAQARLMQAVANSPKFAKKVGVPQSTGKDFFAADQAQKGKAMATKKKSPLFGGKETMKEEAAERKKFPGKGAYKKAEAKFEGERPAMKRGGKVKCMAEGGVSDRFDEDTYERARKFVESNNVEGEQVAEPMSMSKVEGTPLPAARRAAPAKAKAAETPRVSEPAEPTRDTAGSIRKATETPERVSPRAVDMPARVKSALRTYEPPTDDPYAGLKRGAEFAAMAAAPAAVGPAVRGASALARAARSVANTPAAAGVRRGAGVGANRLMPSLTDDVVASQKADFGRIAKALSPTGRGAAKAAQQMAGVRAGARTAGRAGAGGGAAEAGREVGSAISDRMEKDRARRRKEDSEDTNYAKGGAVKSARGVGAAVRGWGRGKMV